MKDVGLGAWLSKLLHLPRDALLIVDVAVFVSVDLVPGIDLAVYSFRGPVAYTDSLPFLWPAVVSIGLSNDCWNIDM